MKNYTLKSREIKLNSDYDVIVVGGGPSGCTAAIASAREGAKTLLIEATGSLGGMGTVGLVPAWCPFSDKERIIYGGLAQKIFEKSKKPIHITKTAMDWQPIDPELLKQIYDDEVTGSGAKILFNTSLCSVEKTEDKKVDTIIVSNKMGLSAYKAKIYIDCTGDADLVYWADGKTEMGDSTGDIQPSTHCFIISNVDEYGYRFGGGLHGHNKQSKIYKILEDKKYPHLNSTHLCNSLIGPGTVGFNAGHIWDLNNTDPFTVSEGLIEGRKIARSYRDSLAEYFPEAFANSFLVATGSLMGIRESRRIVGDYVLTLDDYLDRRTFDDDICRNAYYIDIHFNKSEEKKHQLGEMKIDDRVPRYEKGESHGIPYRCLCPSDLDNVLVAGRSISTDRTVQGSTRVMPVCLCMGEAAGLAAGLAIKSKKYNIHNVNIKKLRERLIEEGAYLPEKSK